MRFNVPLLLLDIIQMLYLPFALVFNVMWFSLHWETRGSRVTTHDPRHRRNVIHLLYSIKLPSKCLHSGLGSTVVATTVVLCAKIVSCIDHTILEQWTSPTLKIYHVICDLQKCGCFILFPITTFVWASQCPQHFLSSWFILSSHYYLIFKGPKPQHILHNIYINSIVPMAEICV